jgi:hypothetical protein
MSLPKAAVIRLFNAVVVNSIKKSKKKVPANILKQTISRGFVFAPEIYSNVDEDELNGYIKLVEKEIGLTPDQMNSSFHKSWKKVATADINQLIIEQLIHYITTYGYESLGIADPNAVYIPSEKLQIPDIKDDKIKLSVIRGYTIEQIKEKILNLLNSGVALSEQSVNDCIEICNILKITEQEISAVKNKEVKIALYDKLNLVPSEPIEFLRYILFKATQTTLLIKNRIVIDKIKLSGDRKNTIKYFKQYEKDYELTKLSEIFFRFKPIFLAFKQHDKMSGYINELRRYADIHHKPMHQDYLNTITAQLKNNKTINLETFQKEVSKVNVFRKVRLLYALNYRLSDAESIVYKVRNGSSYATDFSFEHQAVKINKLIKILKDSIAHDISDNVKNKVIYIPKDIEYALPATEKQFTGNIPSGSYVNVPTDMVVGVHWNNLNGNDTKKIDNRYDTDRIDLDLSLLSIDKKYGWDSYYRSEKADIMFSGDNTTAPLPKGASELFYVQKQAKGQYLLMLNFFNFEYLENAEVPFKIVVAKKKAKEFNQKYMIDPNESICIAKTKINKKQKVLGFIDISPNNCHFYFCEFDGGRNITSSNNEVSKHTLNYFINYFKGSISLKEILKDAGAKIVVNKDDKIDIDLSPENITKESFIKLLTK